MLISHEPSKIKMAAASLVLSRRLSLSARSSRAWGRAREAAVPLTDPIDAGAPPNVTRQPSEELKISKLSNGVTVASLENHSPLSNISVYVRAGSRFEKYNQLGVTHLLREHAFLSTDKRTTFLTARECDAMGLTLNATTTRENMIYSSQFFRGDNTESQALDVLGSAMICPRFQPWEIKDYINKTRLSLAIAAAQPYTVVMEALHQAAFRNTLSNSIYCPPHNVATLTNLDLKSYMDEWYSGKRTSIVGVGVNHDQVVQLAEQWFSELPEGIGASEEQCEYIGGAEVRMSTPSYLTHTAIVSKGASLKGTHGDLIAAGVLQNLLGAAPQGNVVWGANTGSRLFKAGSVAVESPFTVSSLNLCYTDSGLFGIYLVCDGDDTGKLLPAIMKDFSDVARGSVSDEELTRAKNQLKASYLMSTETQSGLVEDIAAQVNLKGSYTSLEETMKHVDSLTKDDIVKFAKTVFSTRPSIVAYGNLSTAPRLDKLVAELSLK
ncbi:cytochrome b-c1 complex subunit 2, mitochondrial-like [Halichondria panicea]|uniref:cytochrome b-c1 complex subunit 2, mitochondrial-like n=1 Tax=Halichondria panicea TaxID=6063 RepID=UPI00312B2DE3